MTKETKRTISNWTLNHRNVKMRFWVTIIITLCLQTDSDSESYGFNRTSTTVCRTHPGRWPPLIQTWPCSFPGWSQRECWSPAENISEHGAPPAPLGWLRSPANIHWTLAEPETLVPETLWNLLMFQCRVDKKKDSYF